MNYPSPCDSCTKEKCPGGGIGCDKWRARYVIRQKQINAYARKVCQPRPVVVKAFQYARPEENLDYLRHSPCEGCNVNKICDPPCAAYLQWWDERMGWVRRNYG